MRKALDILTALFGPEWSPSALARRLRLPKSTAHNLLRTLHSVDLLHQDRERRAYQLGPRALEDGRLAVLAKPVVVAARSTSTYSNPEES